ncbi:hypothetical protein [Allosalinactinospora lopnorensis]|uniref:hypothetical protein n=1 Tax=Allosalinactinospora lopnorensis TaxID=1352348 RepID=UPI000623E210|nr:hypothetical protein [Allosalinactinospora lopnorensis]
MPDGGGATDVLLRALVDDAGLFPPTALPMTEAVRRHRADRSEANAMLTHRFLCPLSRWEELLAALSDRETEAMHVGLLLDTEAGMNGVPAPPDPRVRITHYETPVAPDDVGRAARYLAGVGPEPGRRPLYLEVERGPGWLDAVAKLAGAAPLGAKVRCGGVRAELFPEVAELAAFIATCAQHTVPFKATAGLHHAVRHTDEATGFTHHGYLNLLLATAEAVDGHGQHAVADALLVDDPGTLAGEIRGIPRLVAEHARTLFVSYGSCSTRAPIADVERLGLAGAG